MSSKIETGATLYALDFGPVYDLNFNRSVLFKIYFHLSSNSWTKLYVLPMSFKVIINSLLIMILTRMVLGLGFSIIEFKEIPTFSLVTLGFYRSIKSLIMDLYTYDHDFIFHYTWSISPSLVFFMWVRVNF